MADKKHVDRDTIMEMISQIAEKYRRQAQHAGKNGQGKILSLLYNAGPMSLSSVAEKLGIMTGSASEMVNKLERKGLVVKAQDDQDRRKLVISLSEEGKHHVIAFRNTQRSTAFSPTSCLSDEELLTLQSILQKVICNLEKE